MVLSNIVGSGVPIPMRSQKTMNGTDIWKAQEPMDRDILRGKITRGNHGEKGKNELYM